MDKVVDLLDMKGNLLMRGTRRECHKFSIETFAERYGPRATAY